MSSSNISAFHFQAPGTVAFLGDEGRINLVSLRSQQLMGTLKMAGTARAAAFAPDGQQLLSLGAN
jgi:U3 small nucleolar RNA-associated protein 18